MTQSKVNVLTNGILQIIVLALVLIPISSWSYNKSWDQGHKKCVSEDGKTNWGQFDEEGTFHGGYSSKECCEKLCKVCPVYANTGRYQKTFTDLTVPGVGPSLNITRTYNSQHWSSSLLGYSWTFNFGRKLIISRNDDGEKIIGIVSRTGEKNFFREEVDGTLTRLADYGVPYDLVKNDDNTYSMFNDDGTIQELREDGKISKIIDRNNNELVFTYDSVGCLTRAANSSNNYVDFQLGANGKLASVVDNIGRTVAYGYDNNGNLISVTDPMGNTTQYAYDSNNYLAQIIDPNGNVVEAVTYDDHAPPKVSSLTEKGEFYTIAYFDDRTEKTDSHGNIWKYYFNDVGIIERIVDPLGNEIRQQHNNVSATSVDWEEDANGNRIVTYEYDQAGNITRETDALGNSYLYTYIPGTIDVDTVTNPEGVVTKYEYDGNGNRNRIIQDYGGALERSTSISHDAVGNVTQIIDSLGNATQYQYDAQGHVTKEVNALGYETTYTYDGMGNRLTETDHDGNTIALEYDPNGRRTKITDPLGYTKTYDYDASGNMIGMTDYNGHTYAFQYDQYNRQVKIIDPLGNETTKTYINNYVHMKTDKCGNVIINYYDPLDRLIKTVHKVGDADLTEDADDVVWKFTYDPVGNLLAEENPMGNVKSYTYSPSNQLMTETNQEGEVTSYTYDVNGRLQSSTYPNGNVVSHEYDLLGRKTETTDHYGTLSSLSYDSEGRVESVMDTNGITTTFEYDALGRVVRETDARGNSTTYEYDTLGNLRRTIDKEGHITAYTYDANHQLIIETDTLGRTKNYQYDGNGNQVSITDTNGNTTTYQYNSINQLTQTIYADGKSVGQTYDCFGNLATRTDQQGRTTTYEYDQLYRLTKTDYPDDNDSIFTYDKLSRLSSAQNNSGIISFVYDNVGREIQSTQFGHTLNMVYDIPNRERTVTYPSGSLITETYDKRDRMVTLERNGDILAAYTYGTGNLLTSKNIHNLFTANYSYDIVGLPMSLDYQKDNDLMLQYEYGYDKQGNRIYTKNLRNINNSEEYGYDSRYHLSQYKRGALNENNVVENPNSQIGYTYDGVDNRISINDNNAITNYVSNLTNGYQSVNGVNWQYDNNGNLLDNGQLLYAYDFANNLLSITEKNTANVIASYTYDALGRRCGKTDSAGSMAYVFEGSSPRILVELKNGTSEATYVLGAMLNEIVEMSKGGDTYFYQTDLMGSVVNVLDQHGHVLESYAYDPFGNVTVIDENGTVIARTEIGNSTYFIGQRYHDEANIYEFQNRVYDPEHGRFTTFDPIGYTTGLNLYHYVNNNPVTYYDPTGLIPATVTTTSPVSYKSLGGAFGVTKSSLTAISTFTVNYNENIFTGRECCKDGTIVTKGYEKERKIEVKSVAMSVTIPIWIDRNAHKRGTLKAWTNCNGTPDSSGYLPLTWSATKPTTAGNWIAQTVAATEKHEKQHVVQEKNAIIKHFKNKSSDSKKVCPYDTKAKKEIKNWKKNIEKTYKAEALNIGKSWYGSSSSAGKKAYETEADKAMCP